MPESSHRPQNANEAQLPSALVHDILQSGDVVGNQGDLLLTFDRKPLPGRSTIPSAGLVLELAGRRGKRLVCYQLASSRFSRVL
jgi:hypothetical protein